MRARGRLGRRLLLVGACLVLLEAALQLAAPLVQHAMARGGSPAPGGAFSVLCVGDSNTYGLNVPRLYSYPERLQARLRVRGTDPVTVANRGVPGQNGAQVAAALDRDLVETAPDLVLVLVGINDTWNRDAEQPGAVDWLGRIKLVRLLRVLAAGVTTSTARFEVTTDTQGRLVVDRGDGARPVNAGTGAVSTRAGAELAASVRRALERIVSTCRERGVRVALMTYAETGGDFSTVNAVLRETAAAHDLPLVDHEVAFRQHVAALGYEHVMMNDHHPNARGYDLMAAAIEAALDGAGWLPRAGSESPGSASAPPEPPEPPAARLGSAPAPELEAEGQGRLLLRGPPDAPFQLLVARRPGPGEGFEAGGQRIPLPDDAVLALSRLEPTFSGRLGTDGTTGLLVPERFLEVAGGDLAASLVLLSESTTGPAVSAVSAAVDVQF